MPGQQIINLRYTFQIRDAENDIICTIQRKFFHMDTPFRPFYKVTRGTEKQDVLYSIESNFGGYVFAIKNTDGETVCAIREKASGHNNVNKKKNMYEITCQPNVDCMMMSLLGIVCDCIDNDG